MQSSTCAVRVQSTGCSPLTPKRLLQVQVSLRPLSLFVFVSFFPLPCGARGGAWTGAWRRFHRLHQPECICAWPEKMRFGTAAAGAREGLLLFAILLACSSTTSLCFAPMGSAPLPRSIRMSHHHGLASSTSPATARILVPPPPRRSTLFIPGSASSMARGRNLPILSSSATPGSAGGGPSGGLEAKVVRIFAALTNLFPAWVLAAACLGFTRPAALAWLSAGRITAALAMTMLFMGMTLEVDDFKRVMLNPKQVAAPPKSSRAAHAHAQTMHAPTLCTRKKGQFSHAHARTHANA